MKILSHGKQLSSQALKERFLRCFGVRVNNAALLQDLVKDLIGEGVSRQTLVAWAVEAGYSRASVRSTLSRIFVSLGLRERERGAGRTPSLRQEFRKYVARSLASWKGTTCSRKSWNSAGRRRSGHN